MEEAEKRRAAGFLEEAARWQALILEQFGESSRASETLSVSAMKTACGEHSEGVAEEEEVGDWATVG